MNWVSTVGRRFLQAYSEGLVMTCPLHRAVDTAPSGGVMPAAINGSQADVHAALRPEFAASFEGQAFSSVRH
jgi:hypothetical protein